MTQCIEPAISLIHGLHLSLADKCRQQPGVTDEDIAIAAALAALDNATTLAGGDKSNGIHWLRCALDLIEDDQPLMVETIQ